MRQKDRPTHMKKIIVAPLNWGLGHASRCVPIIKELQKNNFVPIIATDGNALTFLKKEFPTVESFELPSYDISYGKNLKWSLLLKTTTIIRAVKKEQEIIQSYIEKTKNIAGIISDNRFGCYSKQLPSVYMTHQLNVLSGFLTPISSYIHQQIIRKYDECWIPDEENSLFSGKLSRSSKNLHQKYIGVLSRFEKQELPLEIDVLILLSGPEPNRTQLEDKLKEIFKTSNKRVCLIQGKVEETQKITQLHQFKIVNFMLSGELEHTINSSKIIICRAGYSSILDLVSLNKEALLIPTKYQNEQEYLAKYLQEKGVFSFIEEKDIDKKIVNISIKPSVTGFKKQEFNTDLFYLF